ncbi:MAG: TPM domain-containing protein [Flammeovirgaceae bacterium]|nr:TPM domain-containing protein [Flammeovirgaceae bacterium]
MRSFIILFVLVVSLVAFAQKPVPELWGHRVHDDAHVLTAQAVHELEEQLSKYEDSTSNQIAILIVQSLDGDVLEDYSMRVAEKWKLGQKDKDNGVLLLISVDDHKIRIEVGYGLEGVLTDAQSSQIIRNEIAPNFRRDDYDAGVRAAINAIIMTIGGEYVASDENSDLESLSIGERIRIGFMIFLILAIFTMRALFTEGCFGWGLYAFLLPFYAFFPWIVIGTFAGIVLFIVYAVTVPIVRIIISRNPKLKAKFKGWNSSGGSSSGSSRSSGSWSSSSGSSSFSGGGGSFGGGGSSGSW